MRALLCVLLAATLGAMPVRADASKAADEAPLKTSSAYGVNGLVLWIASDSGITLDREHEHGVAQLNDKTGNFILTPNDDAQEPILVPNALNGKPVFRFNGSQSLYSPDGFGAALNRDMTIIIVSMTSTTSGREQFALYLGQNTAPHVNRALPYYEGKLLFDAQFAGCIGGPAIAKTFVMESATLNSSLTEATFYRNGQKVHIGTTAEANKHFDLPASAGFKNLSEGVTLGAATDPVCGWEGDIAETLVYNHALTPAEMQHVWFFLSSKYGLHVIAPEK